jgi:hypothetical protein
MNFPDTPTNGALFTSGGSTWIWNSPAWRASTAPSGAPLYLPLIGGTETGTVTFTGAAPQIILNNATSNWIAWPSVDSAPPSFTTRSIGTKLLLFPQLSATVTDYAIGIDAGTMWFSVPAAANLFNWYVGTTSVMTLGGTGILHAYDTVQTDGDFFLTRQTNPIGYVIRPNVAGYKNLSFAVAGAGPLDQVSINSVNTFIGSQYLLKIVGTNINDSTVPCMRIDSTGNLVINPKQGAEIFLSYDVTSGFVCVGSTTNNVNDPLEIHTPTTNYCRVRYYTSRTWSAGALGSGAGAGSGMFGLADESGGKIELTLGYSGQWHKTYEHWMAGADNTYWCGYTGVAWYGVMSYSFPAPSDAKYKTDFDDLPTCLDLVQAISPQRYRFHSAPAEERHRVHWGFVAQDVEAVMAQRGHDFSGGHRIDNGNHALCYNDLIAVLWKAVQELSEEVTLLKGATT